MSRKKVVDSTVSVSKGCFAFKKKRKGNSLLNMYAQEPWFDAYSSSWSSFLEAYTTIESDVSSKVLNEIVTCVRNSSSCSGKYNLATEIPAAAVLVGVNMPDHRSLFSVFVKKLADELTENVAMLWSRDCTSLRSTVELMCLQFMSENIYEDNDSSSSEDIEEQNRAKYRNKIQRSQCTLPSLTIWYQNRLSPSKKIAEQDERFSVKPLIVIFPDVESFSGKVFQDLVLLLCGYLPHLPFFLVLGVATSVSAIHRSLPHHVSSCVNIQLFQIKPSSEYLSEILAKALLTPERNIHIGGKAFKLLQEVFLYHDFSVTGFVAGYKYCLMEHFFMKNWSILCCSSSELPLAIKQLKAEDLQSLRNLPSSRIYVEKNFTRKGDLIKWLTDDNFFKTEIQKLLLDLHEHIYGFFMALRCVHVFTSDLFTSPIGRNLESLYSIAVSSDIEKDADFVKSMKLLHVISREDLQTKLDKVIAILQEPSSIKSSQVLSATKRLKELSGELKNLNNTNTFPILDKSPLSSPSKNVDNSVTSPKKPRLSIAHDRSQFRKNLERIASQEKHKQLPFEKLRNEILSCLVENLFTKCLVSPCTKPLHEVMFYSDERSLKAHLIGCPRQAVFRALRDPHNYLQCQCCALSSPDEILPSLPDVSIVYKLHLESGRLINMFDWLQSFLTIVNPMDEEQTEVDPKLQARFTQAVAELQLLGFIKSSSRKTDHVTRITWG